VAAHHLQIGDDELLALVKKRLEAFDRHNQDANHSKDH
jgi:hypothetical protein